MSPIFLVLATLLALTALGLAVANRRTLDALARRLAELESQAITPTAPEPAEPARRDPSIHRVDQGESATLSGPTLISVPDLAARSPRTQTTGEREDRFASIWAMADAGFTADRIARETAQPIGQVELILGLKRPRNAAGGARSS